MAKMAMAVAMTKMNEKSHGHEQDGQIAIAMAKMFKQCPRFEGHVSV